MSADRLQSLLGLSDEELLLILRSDPLALITGGEDARPEVALLLALLREAQESVSAATLRRWVRANDERALKLLIAQDFAGFEDALAELRERGLVISPGGRGASRPATRP